MTFYSKWHWLIRFRLSYTRLHKCFTNVVSVSVVDQTLQKTYPRTHTHTHIYIYIVCVYVCNSTLSGLVITFRWIFTFDSVFPGVYIYIYHWHRNGGGGGGARGACAPTFLIGGGRQWYVCAPPPTLLTPHFNFPIELYVYITLTNNYLAFFIYQLIILWTISINWHRWLLVNNHISKYNSFILVLYWRYINYVYVCPPPPPPYTHTHFLAPS